MFNNIKMILGAGLLVVAFCMSYLSYNFYGQIKVLELRYETARAELEKKDEDMVKLQSSCNINSTISHKLAKESQSMGDTLVDLVGAINALDSKQEVLIDEAKKPTLPSPANLSGDAELQRLLDAAYCAADPESLYCAPTGAGGEPPR